MTPCLVVETPRWLISPEQRVVSQFFFLFKLIMSKLTENNQPDLAMSQECENRCIFAMLVVMCVTKQIDGFLSGLDAEGRDFYAQIWDSLCITPVGVLFNRPNFDGK